MDRHAASGKNHSSDFLYGSVLFFVMKRSGRIWCVFGYGELNGITKRNSTPLSSSDKLFLRLGEPTDISKMDLKTGFQKTIVSSCEIKNPVLNT